MIDWHSVYLALLAFGAAVVNGAVGYGFSSIITPIAIFWYSNKVLNPAIVTVEMVVNLALLYRERPHVRATWSHARPVILTLLPGVVLGTVGLTVLAVADVKVLVYATFLPLVTLQLLGFSRPFENGRRGGALVGPGIGFLYALTTISGPPLALFLRNQGLSKDAFRCTIAQIRVAESCLTLTTYAFFSVYFSANLVALPAVDLLPYLFVPVVVGVPLGTLVLIRAHPEFFRRLVTALDGAIVSYGLAQMTMVLGWVSALGGYALMAGLFAFVGVLAWFSLRSVPWTDRGPSETMLPSDPG